MIVKRRKATYKKSSFAARLFRSMIAIIVLSAFVLGISYTVKTLSDLNYEKALNITSPILEKLGFNKEQIGSVAGKFTESADEILNNTPSAEASDSVDNAKSDNSSDTNFKLIVSVLADSHEDNDLLASALDKSKSLNAKAVFFLGDYTDLGVLEALKEAKKVMDESKIPYYSLPGDHDLWKTVGPTNFIEVFGKNYQSVKINGVKFVLLDNSANYTPIDSKEVEWFKNELVGADFVMLSQPLWHPTNDRVMGVVNGEQVAEVRTQSDELLAEIRKSNVKAIIAGDHHISSINIDPEDASLEHIVVGAITKSRNLQTPRFSTLKIFNDGNYKIDEFIL